MVIAIDGPAGAGKSEISKRLASSLGFMYLDTGAMYRAIALCAINSGVSLDDEAALDEMLKHTDLNFEADVGLPSLLLLNGEDVSGKIRTPIISDGSSRVSVHPAVRRWLLDKQRSIAAKGDAIMDGRDIGTVVMPDAEVKIYLTASAEVRAKRRVKQLESSGTQCDYEQVLKEVIERDERDMSRAASPLRRADDAYLVDSSDMTIDEVINTIIDRVNLYRQGAIS